MQIGGRSAGFLLAPNYRIESLPADESCFHPYSLPAKTLVHYTLIFSIGHTVSLMRGFLVGSSRPAKLPAIAVLGRLSSVSSFNWRVIVPV